MAITNSKQNWTIGNTVKIGFMKLRITGIRAVNDGLPDVYDLVSSKGVRYEFIPHNGLNRVS